MGRPLLADPYWAKKALEGHPEDISPCIRCNEGCLDRGNHLGKSINCTMNPTLGFEDALAIRPTATPKKSGSSRRRPRRNEGCRCGL